MSKDTIDNISTVRSVCTIIRADCV